MNRHNFYKYNRNKTSYLRSKSIKIVNCLMISKNQVINSRGHEHFVSALIGSNIHTLVLASSFILVTIEDTEMVDLSIYLYSHGEQ